MRVSHALALVVFLASSAAFAKHPCARAVETGADDRMLEKCFHSKRPTAHHAENTSHGYAIVKQDCKRFESGGKIHEICRHEFGVINSPTSASYTIEEIAVTECRATDEHLAMPSFESSVVASDDLRAVQENAAIEAAAKGAGEKGMKIAAEAARIRLVCDSFAASFRSALVHVSCDGDDREIDRCPL